ncbi:ABC transporter ATP-binding protein (plasmid) [Thermus thermophilus]|uniref:ABC transporter ATP-binding protein n=1 Tax=Thermus thermophilus TaxID=274 RepID=A0AAD1KW86_THETH|nr:nitrate/sulfonate/bicarbonate ABC transporter ATP-binding protein [Thermus thermophilus]BBL83357.1 ABC transporter ATP-binding protein [Thermus thermophilus]BBL85630.1 ABC transporter ATP-binding protein [Thermus thermophilus]BCZ88025.1 ABC transporter ATP-binding protein [Thermus thermophilus]BCZ90359.1 ABC transporter ATP-binding protein [Thermus thermophilus]BCZ93011.1 ABC transporter ATP-binding protein [Thermus thermophilus]
MLLEARNVAKSFQSYPVLRGVDLALREGEIVALLGRSGGGKSTLLRILAGLIPPEEGEVRFRGKRVEGPVDGMAMVFQTFALFPWLTVLENVALGLEARGLSKPERERRAREAIALVGLEGFEEALPKELSGGMRQRVGLARALVVEPEVLFMDEPFSALDPLTAEGLRGDLLDLWVAGRLRTKAILLVTHNLEEAVALADRALVLGGTPGRILAEVPIRLPHPRDPKDPRFQALADRLYAELTRREEVERRVEEVAYRLPEAPVGALLALVETLGRLGGRADLPLLAEETGLATDHLLPLLEALGLLGFAKVAEGDVELTPSGLALAEADLARQKELFAEHLLRRVPLVEEVRRRVLAQGRLREAEALEALQVRFPQAEARRVWRRLLEWGCFAGLFAYDEPSRTLYPPRAA